MDSLINDTRAVLAGASAMPAPPPAPKQQQPEKDPVVEAWKKKEREKALSKTFLGKDKSIVPDIFSVEETKKEEPVVPEKKPRGRPPKLKVSFDSTTDQYSSSLPTKTVSATISATTCAPPKKATAKTKEEIQKEKDIGTRDILVKKILAYKKLFPSRLNKVVPSEENLRDSYTIEELQKLYKDCSTTSAVGVEEDLVKKFIFGVIGKAEQICYFICKLAKRDDIPVVGMLAKCPPGSFLEYLKTSDELISADDPEKSIMTDINEIAIMFIGLLPDSPFFRLSYKLAYAAYNYSGMVENEWLKQAYEEARNADAPESIYRGEFVTSDGRTIKRKVLE